MDRAKYLELLEEARDQILLRPSKPVQGRPKRRRPHSAAHEPTLETVLRKRKGAIEDKLTRNLALLTHRKPHTGQDYLLAHLKRP